MAKMIRRVAIPLLLFLAADATVYIGETGTKYHRADCRTLKGTKTPIALSEAVKTRQPCKVCDPPVRTAPQPAPVRTTEPASAPPKPLGIAAMPKPPPMQRFAGKVVRVTDGDTIVVLDRTKTQIKVRLEGIDAPESGQAFGSRAKQALSAKVFGKTVNIEWAEKDRYGRTLGTVYLGGQNVNTQLVEEGWAWHFAKYSNSQEYTTAESRARAKRAGLWAESKPMAPWDFRAAGKIPAASAPESARPLR